MSTRRATLLTIKSFKTLSKVRSSSNSLDSIRPISLVKNLSTATERSDFQHPNGFNGENNNEYLQNPEGLYSENQNQIDYQHTSNGNSQHRGNNRVFHQIPDGFYRENSVGVGQNPSGVYGINPRNEFQQNPVGQGGKFSNGYFGGTTRNEFQGNPVGQNGNYSSGYYRESAKNDNFDHNPIGQNGIFKGYGENSGELRQNSSGYNPKNVRPLQEGSDGFHGGNMNVQNPYRSNREGAGEVHGDPNRFYQQSGMNSRGTVNGHYRESNIQFQERPSDNYAGNNEPSQQNPRSDYNGINQMSQQSSSNYYIGSTDSSQQNPSNYYSGNNQMSHQSSSNYGMQSTGKSQQTPSNYYTSNNGTHQQSVSGNGGVNVGSSDGYLKGNVGEYQQTPSGNYNANPQKSKEYQNGIVGPHVSSSFKPDGESVQAAENNPYSGTIEELDGFCKEGKLKEAVEVLKLLENQCTPLDLPRYFMLMNACGEAKAIQEAKYVHEHLMRWVSPLEVCCYNKILEMYGTCGSMDHAYTVFNKMPHKNLTSWDTMIISLVKNDLGEDAIDLFTQFKKTELEPDGQMFIGVFSACSILGDISEGMLHFESMSKNYNIVPSMEHYVSVVDMMGSNGYLDEALEFIEKMPVGPSVDVWETLMTHCRVYGNTELGDRLAELVELIDPSHLNEQSKAGLIPVKPSDIAKEKEKKKMAAQNLLEVRSRVHEYRAGDTSHPEKDKIYTLLRGMKQQMKEVGYIPETRFVLHDIDQEGKEEALLAHSERLAVAHGLISSSARSQIRIIKNLRVCGDCHSALKIISKLVGRELIIRDAKRFHHFKDGLCSCRDYW